MLPHTSIKLEPLHDDGRLWVMVVLGELHQLVECLGRQIVGGYQRLQKLVDGSPAHIEENSPFFVGSADATHCEVMKQLFDDDVPIVGCPTELRNAAVEGRYGDSFLSPICCDLAFGPTNNVVQY